MGVECKTPPLGWRYLSDRICCCGIAVPLNPPLLYDRRDDGAVSKPVCAVFGRKWDQPCDQDAAGANPGRPGCSPANGSGIGRRSLVFALISVNIGVAT